MTTPAQPRPAEEPAQFGNLREPKLPGLFALPAGASAFLVLAALIFMATAFVNLWAAIIWAVIAVALVIPTAIPTRDGYGRYEMLFRHRRYIRARKRGETVLRQGLVGATPDGACPLPGVAAATELSSHVDGQGREYGLLHWPHANLYAVVLQAGPSGFAGVDQPQQNDLVAHWAAWLGSLNTVPEIVGAAVTVETVPDSGRRLERAMDRGRLGDDQVPAFASAVEADVRRMYRMGSPTLNCRVTLTLSARVDADEDGRAVLRGREEMADQIGDLLPAWIASLAHTGAGNRVRACTAQQIIDSTRVAFDPSVAVDVEEANLSGEGTGLTWADAGPIYHELTPTTYRHESSFSRTWQMRTPPRGSFYATTLQGLLEPHKDCSRKRVTLLYRPETPEMSTTAAERDVTKALFKANQGRTSALARVELESAQRTALQEAKGAPLVRVGLVITATCDDEAALRRATRAIKGALAAKARLAIRVPAGSQDMAFLVGLPLGLVARTIIHGPDTGAKPAKSKEW